MKSLLPRTVTGQLVAFAAAALVVSQLAMLAIIIDEQQSSIRRWWSAYILTRIASVAELLDETPEPLHEKVLNASDTSILTFSVQSEGPDGYAISEDGSLYLEELRALINKKPEQVLVEVGVTPGWSEIIQQWIAIWRDTPLESEESWLDAYVQINNGKWLMVEVARKVREPSIALLLIPLGTMIIVFGSTVLILIRHVTRPMLCLARAAEAFGRGEDIEPVPADGPTEIRQAIAAFNDMRERLSRFVLDRTKMLAAVGHDLRTPITTMRLRAEFIEDDEVRERILSSLDEMQLMAEGALSFAKEEAIAEPTKTVDLTALVQTVCADQADMNRDVSYAENGRVLYRCRPNSLKRAVRNLVENAVIHGNCARVSMNGPATEIRITIEDDGPGIPEQHLSHVFMPFVRLDESRGQDTGGIGLGLAIARSIVRGHGGDILIRNRTGGGLRATVRLPAL